MTKRLMVICLVLAATVAGCGKSNKVGDKSLLNFKDQAQQQRLGQRTTTTAATATTVAGAKAALGQQTPTTQSAAARQAELQRQQAQQQSQQQAQQQATVQIAINGDGSGGPSQFDPSAARVYRGAYLKWVNNDSVPRSVQSDDGRTFASPTIPPGGTWTWQANVPGSFAYHDGTRPYAVATVEVVNR